MFLLGTKVYQTGFHKVKLWAIKGQEKNLGREDGISPYMNWNENV